MTDHAIEANFRKALSEVTGRTPESFSRHDFIRFSDALAAMTRVAPDHDTVQGLYDALKECADDLEVEINSRRSGELPRRIERDMKTVVRARAAIAEYERKQK